MELEASANAPERSDAELAVFGKVMALFTQELLYRCLELPQSSNFRHSLALSILDC
jgi:hypothetical protein